MFLRNCLLLSSAFVVVFAGCKKADEFPIEPVITFKSLTTVKNAQGYDDHAVLEISFTDGDGDVGLDESEYNIPPYTGEYKDNVHILCYQDSLGTGAWTRLSQFDDLGYTALLTPDGNIKSIHGDIKKDPIFLPHPRQNCHLRYEVYIYDRALHKSNVITTSEIIITKP